jgi:hypothetical protein
VAGIIISMDNSNNIIWNQTRNLPVCSAAPQPNGIQMKPHISRENIIVSTVVTGTI